MTDKQLSQRSNDRQFSMSAAVMLQYMFSVFSVFYLGLVLFSFLLDSLFQYPMCEICLLQRFVMVLLGIVSIVGVLLVQRIWWVGVACTVAVGLLLGLGLVFAVTHVLMLRAVASGGSGGHACKMVSEMTFIPDFWYDFFHSRYQFIPCDQVSSSFLGIGFPYWSLLVYLVGVLIFSLVLWMCFSFVPFDRQRFKISRLRAMQWIQAIVTLILVIFFCVWMAASIYFVSNQRKILYKPDRYDHSHQQALKRVDALQYQINSGVQCAFSYPKASVMGAQSKKHLWIILWGRDAMALDAFFNDAEWSRIFGQLSSSASFLMVDYPGFGWNAGFPNERSNRDSVLQAYKAWRKYHNISETEAVKVYILAHSMGTGVAVDVARSLSDINGVVLVSPFVSIFQMSKVLLGSWMAWTVRPFLLDRYPTGQRLTELHAQQPQLPVAIFHGDNDKVIPVTHSQNMVQANQWIEYYERPGLGHSKRDFAGGQILEVMQKMMQTAESS